MVTTSLGHRYTDAELASLRLAAPEPGSVAVRIRRPSGRRPVDSRPADSEKPGSAAKSAAIPGEVGAVHEGRRRAGGAVLSGDTRRRRHGVRPPQAARTIQEADRLTSVVLTPEHYNRIARLLEHKIPVKLEFDIQASSATISTDSVNVIAEIPGGRRKTRS